MVFVVQLLSAVTENRGASRGASWPNKSWRLGHRAPSGSGVIPHLLAATRIDNVREGHRCRPRRRSRNPKLSPGRRQVSLDDTVYNWHMKRSKDRKDEMLTPRPERSDGHREPAIGTRKTHPHLPQMAAHLRHKPPARRRRRRHNAAAPDTRKAQRRLPKLRQTPPQRRHPRDRRKRQSRRMPRTKIATDDPADWAKAHLTAHKKHSYPTLTAPPKRPPAPTDANGPPRPEKAPRPRKSLKTSENRR